MGAEPDSSQRNSEMKKGKRLGTGCMRGDADWRQGKMFCPCRWSEAGRDCPLAVYPPSLRSLSWMKL